MSDDPLQYGLYYQEALRGIMRKALSAVAENGLPDDHYFHITFRTDHPGVEMPKVLRLQYPDEMAIILQHVFHDLEVDDTNFSVTLSFNRVQQRLTVPLEAVTMFQDPPAKVAVTFVDSEQLPELPEAGDAGFDGSGGPAAAGGAPSTEADAKESSNVIAFDKIRKNPGR